MSSFSPAIGTIYQLLEERGSKASIPEALPKIEITFPLGSGPDATELMKWGIRFDAFIAWEKLPRSLDDYDAIFFLGGPARRQPTGAENDPIRQFLNSPEILAFAKRALERNIIIAALSDGVELLAKVSSDSLVSLLRGRKITGPNGRLDRRRPIDSLVFGGAKPSELRIKALIGGSARRDFSHGPATRPGSIGGFIVQDRNLLTARSTRDAGALTKRVLELLEEPWMRDLRQYYLEYPPNQGPWKQIGIEILDLLPDSPSSDYVEFVYFKLPEDPLQNRLIRDKLRGAHRQNQRLVIVSAPGYGNNYGWKNYFKIWKEPQLQELREFTFAQILSATNPSQTFSRTSEPTSSSTLLGHCAAQLKNLQRKLKADRN
jgi:putative intracellular protease/amidase